MPIINLVASELRTNLIEDAAEALFVELECKGANDSGTARDKRSGWRAT